MNVHQLDVEIFNRIRENMDQLVVLQWQSEDHLDAVASELWAESILQKEPAGRFFPLWTAQWLEEPGKQYKRVRKSH